MTQKSRKEYEEYLNNLYSESLTEDQAVTQFEYLTSPTRGTFVSRSTIRKYYRRKKIGSLLYRLDPILFNVGYSEWR